jgi:hypothetical protein
VENPLRARKTEQAHRRATATEPSPIAVVSPLRAAAAKGLITAYSAPVEDVAAAAAAAAPAGGSGEAPAAEPAPAGERAAALHPDATSLHAISDASPSAEPEELPVAVLFMGAAKAGADAGAPPASPPPAAAVPSMPPAPPQPPAARLNVQEG